MTALGAGRRTALLAALASGMAACFFWDAGDAPAPIVGPGGVLSVSPGDVVFSLLPPDGDAGASSDDVRARVRGRTSIGLGAEGVRITVDVADCDASASDAASTREAGPAQVLLIASVDGGCAEESPARLTCVLSADGLAEFTVRGGPDREASDGAKTTICVRPPRTDFLPPASLTVRVASVAPPGAQLRLDPDAGIAVARTNLDLQDCTTPWVADCASAAPRTALFGMLLTDEHGDAQPAKTSALVRVSVGDGIGLSRDASCKAAAPTIDVALRQAASTTDRFFVCADGRGASDVAVSAAVVGQSTLRAAAKLQVRPQPARVERRGRAVVLLDCLGAPIQGETVVVASNDPGVVVADAGSTTTGDSGEATSVDLVADAGEAFVSVVVPAAGQSCRLKVTR
jgi:hypothetical protein